MFSNRAAFIASLEQHNVPYRNWENSEEELQKLWKEIKKGDTIYCQASDPLGQSPLLTRFLITVAIRVVLEHPDFGMLVLIEFVRKGDYYVPRKYGTTSLSEKIRLRFSGSRNESHWRTVQRCLQEEIRMRVSVEEIKRNLTFMHKASGITNVPIPLLNVAALSGVETHFHEKPQMQGLWHFNQIAHFKLFLHHNHHFIGWRQDLETRYLSRFGSVHEDSGQLEPIPVELILKV